jgi:hypothetical protein
MFSKGSTYFLTKLFVIHQFLSYGAVMHWLTGPLFGNPIGN